MRDALPEEGRRAGPSCASFGKGLGCGPPLRLSSGLHPSLGTFLSELTINRWREAIFFGISAISFSPWKQINMQTGRRSAGVCPSKLSRPPDSGKLQPRPPHGCLSRGRDLTSTRREGGKSPAFVLERSWGWGGGLNPDLARDLSRWRVQSHQKPSITHILAPSLACWNVQKTPANSGRESPLRPTEPRAIPALCHCQHPRVCTLLRLLTTAANFVKLLARPPRPGSFLAWPAFLDAGKEKVITLESWELGPRLAGTLASGLSPGCQTAEPSSQRSLGDWSSQACHRSCCSS